MTACAGVGRPPRIRDWGKRCLPLLLLVAAVAVSLQFGKYPVSMGTIAAVLREHLLGIPASLDPVLHSVVWNIRLPRVLAAVMVGAALSAAGATFQGLFRNPLVSPEMLGISAGAGLGASCAILYGLPVIAIQGAAFAGGLLAVSCAWYAASLIKRRDPVLMLLLAGISLDKLLKALSSLIKLIADPYSQLPTITYWLLGGLNGVSWNDVAASAPALAVGLVPLFVLRWQMNVMSQGEEEARTLGVETRYMRAALVASATLITSASVAIAGPIEWIGLLIPHVARLLVGSDFRRLLPASVLLGAGFVVAMDCLARMVGTTEMPLGLYTSVIGAPFFLWLLMSTRRGW
ncbi:FecCD family ABC transporter permease [Telmatospirillum siberiense]|uniref:Iron ABC transporter permease n=1 Tax=Telmatospirillum siberiense TaxID=382514 RepID=A0A2N3PYW0_9PROT|nr:iron ABC transporter permease [Telmatospirillum siberiense]PKU25597.1 iron ABC transporter permease [Telmatospirillum siberiense]